MNLARNSISAAVFQFTDQLGDQLSPDAPAANRQVCSEISEADSIFPKLINHKTDDAALRFGDHSDRVAPAKRREKIILRPGAVGPLPFDRQYLVQVSANHPAKTQAAEPFRMILKYPSSNKSGRLIFGCHFMLSFLKRKQFYNKNNLK